jgi:cytochrome c
MPARNGARGPLAVFLAAATLWTVLFLVEGCGNLSASNVRAASTITGGGNAHRGPGLVRAYGCVTCHTISELPGARGLVGPPLDGVSQRLILAGELPNTPENLILWIQHPRSVEPHTVMPEMNVSEQDSRDIAAYLYTLRDSQ